MAQCESWDINKYKECTETACGSLYCNDNNCNLRDDIDELYENIKQVIASVSLKWLKRSSEFKPFLKPYWDNELKLLYKTIKNMRNIWITEGRRRGNNFCLIEIISLLNVYLGICTEKNAEKYIQTLNEEIDTAAEVDNGYFWKLENRQSSAGSSIK